MSKKIGSIKSLGEIPELKSESLRIPDYYVYEYFNISITNTFVCIWSGLKNPTVKSPYFYEEVFIGEDCREKALIGFNTFLKEKNL